MSGPVVTDESVEAAYAALVGDIDKSKMRAALEAAAPLLGPRPLLDPDVLAVTIRTHTLFPHDEVETIPTCACGWKPDGNPVLWYSQHARHVCDALMRLARPMPTREQIVNALVNEGAYCGDCDYAGECSVCDRILDGYADAILALLNGRAS